MVSYHEPIYEERVTAQDARRVGYCLSGCQQWCAKSGIDFRKFVREGIPVSELPQDDAMIQHILRAKRG